MVLSDGMSCIDSFSKKSRLLLRYLVPSWTGENITSTRVCVYYMTQALTDIGYVLLAFLILVGVISATVVLSIWWKGSDFEDESSLDEKVPDIEEGSRRAGVCSDFNEQLRKRMNV